jgi:Family of unknown function (DUF5681)
MKRGPKGRFVPGKSGNPGGRPKAEICLTALLRAALAERDEDGKRTKARAVIDALVEQACEGKTQAIEAIFDRIDGILQPVKTEALDIGTLIEAVAQRAELRKRERTAD